MGKKYQTREDYQKNHPQRFDYESIKKVFEENGCKLLSTEYKNARTHLEYECSCGNRASIIYDSFRRGHRCRKCGTVKMADSQKDSYEDVKKYIESKGCFLAQDYYENQNTKMKMMCRCGKVFERIFNLFKTKKRYVCYGCSTESRSGENHYEWKVDREQHFEDFIFRQKCYKILKHSLKSTGKEKEGHTKDLLGYTHTELRDHVKNHPSWNKVKNGSWHLDHIFPIAAFIEHGIRDLKLINCLENLQPMEASENISKNDNYDEEEFAEWLKNKRQLKG